MNGSYDIATDGKIQMKTEEFYKVSEGVPPSGPLLDEARSDLLPGPVNKEQQMNFDRLRKQMNRVLASAPACPGDGNGDGVVNDLDVTDFYEIFNNWGKSSHYDFNLDGFTNGDDLKTIYDNFGPCPKPRH